MNSGTVLAGIERLISITSGRPLIIATGAGALSRFAMGLVIASGIAIGTLFTLFVVPAVYVMLAGDHSRVHEAAEAGLEPETRPGE